MKNVGKKPGKFFIGLVLIPLTFMFLACSGFVEPTSIQKEAVISSISRNTFTSSANAVSFTLEMPAANPIIAPERDFYVLGGIVGDIPDDALLMVTLYRDSDGQLMRQVSTNIKSNKDGIDWEYPYIVLYGSDNPESVKDSLMPDLIYDPSDPVSFQQQWRKCYYDDYNYTATFNGGRYTFDVYPYDQWGNSYEPITAGSYKVVVYAESSTGEVLGSSMFPITIGYNPVKIMSRFSPAQHFANIQQESQIHGYTLYTDPFAGLFDTVQFLVNYPSGMEVWINRKWRIGDLIEYETGQVHFYIYDVATNSTTWAVELATIQTTLDIDDPKRLICYYYDIGDLSVGTRTGQFVSFDVNDRLQLMRVDYQSGSSTENYVVFDDLASITSDFDVLDGVNVTPGDIISLYGVVKPIQVDPSRDMTWNEETSEYTIENRIFYVQYHISPEKSSDFFITKTVGLQREFASDYIVESLLEFKHDFSINSEWAGQNVNVSLQAYDSKGNLVPDTYEEFSLFVAP